MENSSERQKELRAKILAGCQLAFDRMLDYKCRNGGSIVYCENGKIITVKAIDYIESEKRISNDLQHTIK